MQGECDDFLLIFFEGMITARFRKTKVVEKVRKEMYFLFKNFFFFSVYGNVFSLFPDGESSLAPTAFTFSLLHLHSPLLNVPFSPLARFSQASNAPSRQCQSHAP